MNLYLVQHAHARREEEDPERHLSPVGKAAIREMARFAGEHVHVSKILHSGKARVRETAETLAETLRPREGVEATDGLDPKADPAVWAERLRSSVADLMLVGHLPHLSRLASLLLCGDEERTLISFQMGGILYAQRSDDRWSVGWMVVPGLL